MRIFTRPSATAVYLFPGRSPGSSTNMLLVVPPTFRVWPLMTSLCDEWSADTSDTRTATNGATLAWRGLMPDFEPVNVSSVRAGSDPPGTVDSLVGGGFTGLGAVAVDAGGGGTVAVCVGAGVVDVALVT